jgi:flagellar protein FlgJ
MTLNTGIAQTAVDFNGLAELRRSASKDKNDQETLKQVAGQFEALFVNMMLKSMRKAKLADGIFDSSQSDMYRDLADQQLAMDLSKRGGLGLQDVIVRQLGGQSLQQTSDAVRTDFQPIDMAMARVPSMKSYENKQKQIQVNEIQRESRVEQFEFDSPESFVKSLWPMAKKAAEQLGVEPEVILSQAALETGWGKHILNRHDGQSSYNLFNIKANKQWEGEQAIVGTVEYRNGTAVKEQAQFRAYHSYQQSFDDYVNFLQNQPRYRQALQHTDNPERFVEELHKAGYATDPAYAEKIKRIMRSSTLAQISHEMKYS